MTTRQPMWPSTHPSGSRVHRPPSVTCCWIDGRCRRSTAVGRPGCWWSTTSRREAAAPSSSHYTLTGDAELATLLALDPHPHVVTALDVAEIGGRRGIVLEYVPTTLAGLRLDVPGGTEAGPPAFRAEVLQEICDGMDHLSRHGEFAHLDLKPSNILVDAVGRAKIADFGLARQVRIRDGRFPSASGGTWTYAAPEVLRQEPCDSRADIFSFGVLLYEARTGRLPYPFDLMPSGDAQRAQLLDYYESLIPRQHTPQLQTAAPDEKFDVIISSCLQIDVSERPRSFRHLAGMIAEDLHLPQVRAATVPLSGTDRQRRELAVSQALVRLGRFDEAVRRLNRLLSTSLPPALSAAVLQSTRNALIGAGRSDDAATLPEW